MSKRIYLTNLRLSYDNLMKLTIFTIQNTQQAQITVLTRLFLFLSLRNVHSRLQEQLVYEKSSEKAISSESWPKSHIVGALPWVQTRQVLRGPMFSARLNN